uniref:Uncharacterized protein n=1 Tax=Cannabis sativa TaxID=3483 RepID=A0A803PXR7_CANSA
MEYIAIFIAFVFPGALVAFNHNLPHSLIAHGLVIINGAAKEIGRAAVIAVTKARGMEVAGAVDSYLVGEDIGKEFHLDTVEVKEEASVVVLETIPEATQAEVFIGEPHSNVVLETILEATPSRTPKKYRGKGKTKVPPPA